MTATFVILCKTLTMFVRRLGLSAVIAGVGFVYGAGRLTREAPNRVGHFCPGIAHISIRFDLQSGIYRFEHYFES